MTTVDIEHTRFDVVIVGGGSSGGALAARLSEIPDLSVGLVEAGRDFPDEATDPPSFYVGGQFFGENGAGIGAPVPELDWGIWSTPLRNGRRFRLWRGKLLGGTSMINACIAVRGRPSDFDGWHAASGDAGWSWAGVEPYYEKVHQAVHIKNYPRHRWLPFQQLFYEGWLELGFRPIVDANAPDAWDGAVGACPQNRRDEVRLGTLVTYLREARGRPNLRVVPDTLVDRVIFDGTRAIGIRYLRTDDTFGELHASMVVLSAGAYGSPAILLRSGIGRASKLAGLGIRTLANLPVGERLLEHPSVPLMVSVPAEYAYLSGPQFAVLCRGDGWWSHPVSFSEERGLCLVALLLTRNLPVGEVRLASSDPRVPPLVDHHYDDVVDADSFDGPWEEHRQLGKTRAFLDAKATIEEAVSSRQLIRGRITSGQHPVGGSALGSVVDAKLQVLGIENLFVADASIFPTHVSNNPNLTCLMVGEKAAEVIADHLR